MFRYRLTPSAQQDLRTIRDYIRDVLAAPDSAAGLMEAFENAFERACRHPLALPPVTDARLQGRGYR